MRASKIIMSCAAVHFAAHVTFAGFTFSVDRTTVDATYDRVTIFALETPYPGETVVPRLFGAEVTIVAAQPSALRFATVDSDKDGVEDQVVWRGVDLLRNRWTLVDATVFQMTVAGATTPEVDTPEGVARYRNGISTFHTLGFDGQNWNNVPNGINLKGVAADLTVNEGRGAAFASAVVPRGVGVSMFGRVGDQIPGTQTYPFSVASVPEPVVPSITATAAVILVRRRRV